jgi:hypothetical protein
LTEASKKLKTKRFVESLLEASKKLKTKRFVESLLEASNLHLHLVVKRFEIHFSISIIINPPNANNIINLHHSSGIGAVF